MENITLYRVAIVTFSEFGDEYTYLCEDESIKEDNYVVVPVGTNHVEKGAHVKEVYEATKNEIAYPVDKLKRVIKRYSEFDKRKADEIVLGITNNRTLS
ncbi:TPA: hypothetical protein ACGOY4_001603 [Streptococcus suis]